MLSRPKEGSIGSGTGGYTSGLGSFKDHLGYGSSLFGEGGGSGKSSGMVSPDAAAGQIASKTIFDSSLIACDSQQRIGL